MKFDKLVEDIVSRTDRIEALKTLGSKPVFTRFKHPSGGSRMGLVTTTYDKLVSVFGEPDEGVDKTTAEWTIRFPDGQEVNIYDWKEDTTPMGEYEWHIGGHDPIVVARIASLVGSTEYTTE